MQHNHNHDFGRRGTTLADGEAHGADHNHFGRRSFLRNLGLVTAGGMLLNRLPVSALAPSRLNHALTSGTEDRILVLIRLQGGNDGLNTIIPVYDYGTYEALRPGLAIPIAQTMELNGSLRLTNHLSGIYPLWQDGKMKVVNNVGYPDQNLSHFRSSDIWASSSDADDVIHSGYLGRLLENRYPDYLSDPPEFPPALQIGGSSNLLFSNSEELNMALSTNNPQQLYDIAQTGQLYDALDVPDCTYGEQLGYLRAVANTTFRYAGVIHEAFEQGDTTGSGQDYMGNLGDQLSLVARLIRGGLGTRLYMVTINGFDTHANQPDSHPYLMESIGHNVGAFFADLAQSGNDQRTLAMSMSEFGRRPEQNGSQGTDHGAAAPMLLFGAGLNGNGSVGGLPDMVDLDQAGNMKYTVDFRSVYATVLNYWLCLDDDLVNSVLGGDFPRMDGLGLFCDSISSSNDPTSLAYDPQLKAYVNGGDLVVEYVLPAGTSVGISLYDALGRELSSPFRGEQISGEQRMRFPLQNLNWSAGVYVCSLSIDGQQYARKIAMFR
ncbi:MAG: DUF1501 domain-containing protein [Saprospiraceae bacterium]